MHDRSFAHVLRAGLLLPLLLMPLAPAEAEAVKLSFAWPKNLAGTAKFSAKKTRGAQGHRQVIAVRGSYGFTAKPVADGQLISFGKTQVDVQVDPPVAGIQGKLQQFMLGAANRRPSYVVDGQGKYLRLEGMERYRRDLRQGYGELLGEMPDETKQRVQTMIEGVLSDQQLEARMAQSWNRDVGSWAGAEFERGKAYEREYSNPVPMLGNTAVPMKATYRYLGPVKCGKAASTGRCAHLEIRTSVDSDKVAQALEAFIKRMAGQGAGEFRIEKFQVDTTVRLVTEPDTLVPHRLEQQKASAIVISRGGQSRTTRQVEEMAYEYTYAAR